MTSLRERPAPYTSAKPLRALAGVEVRRYARHPLFVAGLALLAVATYAAIRQLTKTPDVERARVVTEATILPTFCLGLLGVLLAHGLARSLDGSREAIEAAPADGRRRTAALCWVCVVPACTALGWVAVMHLASMSWPVPDSSPLSRPDRAAILLSGVACAAGGPLVGVLTARVTRARAAGLVAVMVLVAWVLLGTFATTLPPSRGGTLLHVAAPFVYWVTSDSDGTSLLLGGAPGWHLAYQTMLCALAVTAALHRASTSARRSYLLSVGVVLGLACLVCLALAAAPDPTPSPL